MEDGPYKNTRLSSTGAEKSGGIVVDGSESVTPEKCNNQEDKDNIAEKKDKIRTPSGQILKPINDIRNFFSSQGVLNTSASESAKVSRKRPKRNNKNKDEWKIVQPRRLNKLTMQNKLPNTCERDGDIDTQQLNMTLQTKENEERKQTTNVK